MPPLHFISAFDHPRGLRAFAKVLLVPAGGVCDLAQPKHLKQPMSPACPMNGQLKLQNFSLLNSYN